MKHTLVRRHGWAIPLVCLLLALCLFAGCSKNEPDPDVGGTESAVLESVANESETVESGTGNDETVVPSDTSAETGLPAESDTVPAESETGTPGLDTGVAESETRPAESESGVEETKPDAAESESVPEVTETEPEVTETEPEVTETEPEVTETEPEVTETETEPETPQKYELSNSMTAWTDPVIKVTPEQPSTEDPALRLWFDHLTEKRARYDTPDASDLAHTTYTVQMARNEMEGCHFYLYHPNEKKLLIEYTPFTHSSGATLSTELGVEFYYEEGYLSLKGFTAGTTAATGNKIDIYPDGVIPYASYINANYGDDEGGSYEYGDFVMVGPYSYKPWDTASYPFREAIRGFVLQATTTATSEAGQYSAVITVKDYYTGDVIKVANAYAYVYPVTLSDEPALDTAIGMWQASGAVNAGGEIGYLTAYNMFGGYNTADVVRSCADFMLKYRLTPTYGTWAYTDVLCPTENGVWDTSWLENPRVSTIKVQSQDFYSRIKALNNPEIYKKMFYYGQDEPCVPRNQMRTITLEDGTSFSAHDTYGILALIGVAEETKMLQNTWGWTDYRHVIPYERNPLLSDVSAYPTIDKYGTTRLTWDRIRASFTTDEARTLYDRYATELQTSTDMVDFMSSYVNVWASIFPGYTPRVLSSVGGAQYMQTKENDAVFGEYRTRMLGYQANGGELWNYVSCEPKWNSPYQNILLFNDGTEARTMFWTMYKNRQTGFLYWREDYYPGIACNTYTLRDPFSKTGPGDGILIYPGAVYGQLDPIPSIRLINMRDGVEDYELLHMLEEKYGEDVAMELVENIVTSVVTFTRDDDRIYDVHAHLLQLLAE